MKMALMARDNGRSGKNLDAVLIDKRQELERWGTRLLRPAFPLLHGAFAGAEVAGENRLTDLVALAQPLDFSRRDRRRRGQAAFIEMAHGRLVDHPDTMERFGRRVDRLEGIAFKLARRCHCISPSACHQPAGEPCPCPWLSGGSSPEGEILSIRRRRYSPCPSWRIDIDTANNGEISQE